jgi:hypothetical protein
MPDKDTRLIFIEALEPFLSDESRSRITSNVDIIEQRLAEEWYFGRFIKKLQDDKLKLLDEKQQVETQLKEALEKQTPKKPIENFYDENCGEDDYDEGYTYSCPCCENEVGRYSKQNEEWLWNVGYCPECGQKLNWNCFA